MRNTDWRKFNDWYRSLRIVLRVADTYDYLYKPCLDQPLETASEEDKAAWKAEYKKHNDVACLMLGKMSPALQKQFESYPSQLMLAELKKMFEKPPAVEIYDLVDALHSCKQAPGKSVSAHVLEMKGYMDQLHALGKSYDNDMAINLINRLVHIGKTRMQKLQREGLLESINDESFDKCESCISGKMTKKFFNNNIERATDLLGLIHTDVCEPHRHVSRKGASYFLTFTDDFSHYGYVYLLKHKHEVKALRSDKGGEYLSQEFKDYLSKNGIVQHLTYPYTPQQNGVSERRNRTLIDMVRSMFNLTTLPLSFWDYALESAVRILYMVPTKKVDKTPYEIWHGNAPNLSYLKVWGCEAYVKRDSADKLHQISVKCIFVGYPKETMGYYFYFPPENKVIVARYGNFLERDLISQMLSGRDNDLEDDHMDTLPSENTSEIPVENDEVGDLGEPANYKAAMLDLNKVIWQGAMDEEMNSMKVMKAWIVVDLPPNAKVVRSKWLYKKKTNMDDIRAIRILIAIPAYYDYEIWQMDVKTAFLNGRLDEDIYIEQPEGDRSRRLIGLSQSVYIDKILKKYNMHTSKKGYLPMEVNNDLSNELRASTPEEVAYMKKVPYASAVGSIMYVVRCTRPDVVFAQNLVSRYQQNPGKLHWVAVKDILKYLRNMRDMFLVYGGKPDTELDVTGFCDASWRCDKDDTKSQTGYVFVVNGRAVDWKSK
nr:hypothetical protein [Tanacetum cinerariifolium]